MLIFSRKEGGILSQFTSSFSATLRELFSEKELQKKASDCGFYKRKCGFTPSMFFDILLYCASRPDTISLSQICSKIRAQFKTKIAKQSLDARFSEESVAFVKSVFTELLEKQLSKVFCADFLSKFNQVRIKDSTRYTVPNRLQNQFKGCGGGKGTSKAGVSIQYEYDARSGRILDLNVTAGVRNDATDANETATNINKDDLIVRDLGYFNMSVLNGFVERGASFISRLNACSLIYDPITGNKIEFKDLYIQMRRKKLERSDNEVIVGKYTPTKLRLIVEVVPEHIYQERIRKVKKSNKENGWTTSEEYKARCRFNIFITNVPSTDLSVDEALGVYRLRWQIELTFKSWKSVCRIDKIQPMKYERFACLLYAKLILILLKTQIISNLRAYYFISKKRLLSDDKCFKTLRDSYDNLRDVWKEGRKKSERKLKELTSLFSSNHWKEKRNNKKNLIEIISLLSCKSNNYMYI